jgi:hypothetical protein
MSSIPNNAFLAALLEYKKIAELQTNADFANMAGNVPANGGRSSAMKAA